MEALRAVYGASEVTVWVEDAPTRDYLAAAWGPDRRLQILAAAGADSVSAFVRSAQATRFTNVFGIVDRDYAPADREAWRRKAVLRISRHEIENFALDGDALAAAGLGRPTPAQNIEARMRRCAAELVWSTACRRVMTDLRHALLDDFPPGPSRRVDDADKALAHICGSRWFGVLPQKPAPDEIKVRLGVAGATANAQLQDGTWRGEFPGKELLTAALGEMGLGAESLSDALKAVAAWQLRSGAVDEEIFALRDELLSRI